MATTGLQTVEAGDTTIGFVFFLRQDLQYWKDVSQINVMVATANPVMVTQNRPRKSPSCIARDV